MNKTGWMKVWDSFMPLRFHADHTAPTMILSEKCDCMRDLCDQRTNVIYIPQYGEEGWVFEADLVTEDEDGHQYDSLRLEWNQELNRWDLRKYWVGKDCDGELTRLWEGFIESVDGEPRWLVEQMLGGDLYAERMGY